MKSVSNKSILNSSFQVLHVHVLFVSPLGTSYVAQPCTDQHKGRIVVRESSYHASAAAKLPVEPLNDVVCADTGPVFTKEITQ